WATERVENAMLRERINDVAAEVARLTAVLEGPGSAIESILAEAVPTLGAAERTAPLNGGETGPAESDPLQQGKGTLADRIRALQTTASRVSN
ncbi:MAG: hypothetical protein KGL96_13845, partial [Hyphomicrobiales bacterium]|nr:hypothetical protein [Hyphomicrobiales bacterium]